MGKWEVAQCLLVKSFIVSEILEDIFSIFNICVNSIHMDVLQFIAPAKIWTN